jgi:KUP system potassium uptake protein
VVLLTTVATVVASQAVITGAYSLTRQAIQLGLLPRLGIRHTSGDVAGQIYLPRINWLLLIAVLLLVVVFKSSSALTAAYGVAVTATMITTSMMALFVIWKLWRWPLWQAAALIVPLLLIEQVFFAANIMKIWEGAWVPLVIAFALMLVMLTWQKGTAILSTLSRKQDATLTWLVGTLEKKPPHRVNGTAVFLTGNPHAAPSALLHNLKHNHMLHERNVILTIESDPLPRVDPAERVRTQLGLER